MALGRIFRAIWNPESFWRQLFRHLVLARKTQPKEWFALRHDISKRLALMRHSEDRVRHGKLDDIFPDIHSAAGRVQCLEATAYNVSWYELCAIAQIVALLRPKRVFEFGTFDGRTTLNLALNVDDRGEVFSLDIQSGVFEFSNDGLFFETIKVGEKVIGSIVEHKVSLLTGDSRHLDVAPFSGNIDLVFIDADHSFGAVLADTERAFQMLRPGGIIIWHDYLVIGDVTRAIAKIAEERTLYHIVGTSVVVWRPRV